MFSEIEEIPAVLDQKIFPSLNGLRAISILMVVIYHLVIKYQFSLESIYFLGSLGVNIFFVISGFLITTLCIKEKVITGNLSLKNFYIRRALRILPVAYLYIFTIVVLNYFFNLNIASTSVVAAMLFVTNISFLSKKFSFDWDLAHYWTLSTEEQYYIFFPGILKKNFGAYVAVVLLICLGLPIIIHLKPYISLLNEGVIESILRYLLKFQGIATGCLFSILMFKGYFNFGRWQLLLTVVSIYMIFHLDFNAESNLRHSFSNLATFIFIGIIVVNNIRYTDNILYKFLNLKVLNLIGLLSYSIYIWQQLFLSNDPNFPLSKYPVNLIFVLVVPCLSYFFYERYFLKLKTVFAKKES